MEKINERETAVNILTEILQNKAYNNIALRESLSRLPDDARKPFITEVVNGTLRNIIHIDHIINLFSNTKTEKMKPLILNILRTAVYQIKFMDRVPASAAVNEAVSLAKGRGFQNLSGFVNGVLRNIERNKNKITYPDKKTEPIKFLSIYYSYPEWLLKHFLKELTLEQVEGICEAGNTPPKVTVCVNTLKTEKTRLVKLFEEKNIKTVDVEGNALLISNMQDVAKLLEYKEGLFHIIDRASMLCVEKLAPAPGERLMDVCAAPGGKSFYAAYLMENKGEIVACDIHPHKTELIKKTAERLGINIIHTELRDASRKHTDYAGKADCVLVDAPCSGLGLIRKKPDIKYTKKEEDILSLQKLQQDILAASSVYVRQGGRLVYSTCTVSKEENSDNIEWFLKNFPFTLEEKINILPGLDTDGFFIALMRRD